MPGREIHVYHESAGYLVELIRRIAPELAVTALTSRAELAAALPAIEVLFAPAPPFDGWGTASRLRLIQLLGVGADTLLPSPDLPSHVAIAGVRGEFAIDVAEHALALMFAHARGLAVLAAQQRAHHWHAQPRTTLAGQRLTIVGHGAVGQRLAMIARALDMQVRAVSRSGHSRVDGVECVAVDRIGHAVADASYVVVAVPLTPATRGLVDAAVLARMRHDAYLIHVARGGVVAEHALAEALQQGRLSGAALDVLATEPLPASSPLWDIPNLVITPHVAGLGERYVERCVTALLANVAALAAGAALRGCVDRELGY